MRNCIRSVPIFIKVALTVNAIFFIPCLHVHSQIYIPSLQAESFYSGIPDSSVNKIENAILTISAPVKSAPRKLLIFNLNMWDKKPAKGHPSVPYANYAIMRMGEQTGAYKTYFSSDTLVFRMENLSQFDAICFNNTTGVLFEDPELRNNLLEFIYSGKGFIGIHAAGATFCQWPVYDQFPEYGEMLGGYENGGHPWKPDEWITLKIDDPGHPVNKAFPHEYFDVSDEVFQFSEPYSRDKLRILLTVDTIKTDWSAERRILPERRADKDIAISWVRNYGRGRVFYTSLGHNPHLSWNSQVLQHYFDGILFAMGETAGPVVPSNKLTPSLKAQESLEWKLGIAASPDVHKSLFETIDLAGNLGLLYAGANNNQKVSSETNEYFDFNLSGDKLMQIKKKLLAAGITLVDYYIPEIPSDEETCKKLFEFGRKMGIETFISEPRPEALDLIEKYCIRYNIKLAVRNFGEDQSSSYGDPESIMAICKKRSSMVGAFGDTDFWERSGIQPLDALKILGNRLITIQMPGQNKTGPGALIKYCKEAGLKPLVFSFEYSDQQDPLVSGIKKSIDLFNTQVIY
jgi:hypothetical protein